MVGTASCGRSQTDQAGRSSLQPTAASGEEALQGPGAAHVAESAQGLLLDLPDPLAGDAEQAANLLERHRLGTIQTEIEAQNLGLALLQRRQHFLDRLGQRMLEGLGIGARILGIRKIVEQLVVLAGREW